MEQTETEIEIENPIIFDDKASNGTPRMKMDLVRVQYPKLFGHIMEAFQTGKPFVYGEFSYKVQTNDQYGNTVYQNKAGKGGTKGAAAAANNQELIAAINNLQTTIQNNTVEIAHLSQLLKGRNA